MLRYNVIPALATALLLAAAAGSPAPARAQPRVVASILPVHSLVAGVMDGVGTPALLVRGGASPHAYSLRPSDARALGEADVVFWVGEALETFLAKPLRSMAADARVVTLLEAQGLRLLPAREGGAWEDHAEDAHAEAGAARGHDAAPGERHDEVHARHMASGVAERHGHDAGEAHAGINPHVWLHPANARAMVRAIVAALGAADPGHAARYAANGARVEARLDALDAALRERLAPVADRPYVVFHDAYPYLEAAYGLRPVGAITVSPEQAPGARRIAELRDKVRELDAVCVFSEPQFQPRLVRTIVEGTGARTGVLDPLGADLPAGPQQYFRLMNRLAEALAGCLAGG